MIKRFGFRVPILIETDGRVIDGHLRIRAAKFLGLETLPCVVVTDLSDIEIRALRLSVNKLADLATWDFKKLSSEFDEVLKTFSLDDVGWTEDELPSLDFEPELFPSFSTKQVSDRDVATTQERLNARFETQERGFVNIECPHCDSLFTVSVADLK